MSRSTSTLNGSGAAFPVAVRSADTDSGQDRDSGRDPSPGSPSRPHRRGSPERCGWCGRRLPEQLGVGRRRRYCGQSCRQRAYENRTALDRGSLPDDAVVLSADERDDLADRLFQMRCSAEDVATALSESAPRAELTRLVEALLDAARTAERIR